MDDESEWEAIGMFSPSKARAQQALAKDWSVVDSWLKQKYGLNRSPPDFERNEATLSVLRNLATTNARTDDQQDAIRTVEQTAYQALLTKRNANRDAAYHRIIAQLDVRAQTNLETLSDTSLVLGTADLFESARCICDVTTQRFELQRELRDAQAQCAALTRERVQFEQDLDHFQKNLATSEIDSHDTSGERMRETKALRQTIADYEHRLSILRADSAPRLDFTKLSNALQEATKLREQLAILEAEKEAHQSLPQDLETLRAEVKRFSQNPARLT